MIHALHARQIDRYFSGELQLPAVADMLERVWRCPRCRARYERHLLLESALPDGEARGQERLWRSIVAASAGSHTRPSRVPRPTRLSGRWLLRSATLAVGAALAGMLLLAPRGVHVSRVSAPVARGTAVEDTTAPTLHLFRSVGQHQTEPIERTLHADDGVLIAYSNPGAQLAYLMVFAVDGRGGVHWYYPAYEEPGQHPAAPAIRTRALGVELGEEIRHRLPLGPLRVFALFLPRPLVVDEVERMVSDAWRSHGGSVTALQSLPIQDGEQLSRLLEVTP